MFKVPKQAYTTEFKTAAVQRVKDGHRIAGEAPHSHQTSTASNTHSHQDPAQ